MALALSLVFVSTYCCQVRELLADPVILARAASRQAAAASKAQHDAQHMTDVEADVIVKVAL